MTAAFRSLPGRSARATGPSAPGVWRPTVAQTVLGAGGTRSSRPGAQWHAVARRPSPAELAPAGPTRPAADGSGTATRLLVMLLLLLLLAGCRESLYAPAPEEVPCGTSEDYPCSFDCELDCAAAVVERATSCMQSLQGAFDANRTRCEFVDGGQVRFPWPVPAAGSDLTARAWKLELSRAGASCLAVDAEPLPWASGSFRSRTEVTVQGATYRQVLTMSATTAPVGDGGGPAAEAIAVDCLDGRRFEAAGPGVCDRCQDGDCRNLPLVELHAAWSGELLDLELRAGSRVTPLFTCR